MVRTDEKPAGARGSGFSRRASKLKNSLRLPGRRRWARPYLPGQSPGTLTADPEARATTIEVMGYGPQAIDVLDNATLEDVRRLAGVHPVLWVNITGLADVGLIEQLGEIFHLERLGLEDTLSGTNRPKIEYFEQQEFIVLRKVMFEKRYVTSQVSIFLGQKYVISFHEKSSAYLAPVRERITKSKGKIRKSGADYLTYALIDCIIDHYFPVMSGFMSMFGDLDQEVFENPGAGFLPTVRELRRYLVEFQSFAINLRDVINRMLTEPATRVTTTTKPYLKDCLDHVLQVIDQTDSLRHASSDLMNLYHSQMTQKLNETMKVLTIIATIFIPLTFITSIYRMNFNPAISPFNMPELNHRLGYPAVIIFMVLIGGAMVWWFMRKGWIFAGAESPTAGTSSSAMERIEALSNSTAENNTAAAP